MNTPNSFFFNFLFWLGDQPNPAPAGQVDYTKAWEEYYKKMGTFYFFLTWKFYTLRSFVLYDLYFQGSETNSFLNSKS